MKKPDSRLAADLAVTLRAGPPGDSRATPQAVQRVIRRALSGGRIDDVLRGGLTLTSGMWLLAGLCRDGRIRLESSGLIRPCDGAADPPPPASDGGLVDPRLSVDVLDWQLMAAVLARRPYQPNPDFFQSFDTFASLQRRISIMDCYNDLADRVLLQLGDDEMFSVALALTGQARHVHVADADPAVLAAISAEARKLELPLTAHRVDVLRQQVPVDDVGTFFVSNLKDAGGLMLCTACAVAATAGPGSAGYISFDLDVFKPGHDDRQVYADLARMFGRLDCVLTAMMPGEDLMLEEAGLAELQAAARMLAQDQATPLAAAQRLREMGAERPGPLSRRIGYPDVALRSAVLARVATGPDSRRVARRVLTMLQRTAQPYGLTPAT